MTAAPTSILPETIGGISCFSPSGCATQILFGICALILIFASLGVVGMKNPVRATLMLIIAFAPTAVIYILLSAPFVGLLQVMVYAGAILMLFTFVIMMVNPDPKDGEIPTHQDPNFKPRSMPNLYYLAGFILTASIILPIVHRAASNIPTVPISKHGFGGLDSIARLIYQDPMNNPLTLSFELISFLIMVGIIASIHFSRKQHPNKAGK